MADEIKNAPEDQSTDISDTVPEKPKRKRTTKKIETVAEIGENIISASEEPADDIVADAKPPVKRKPRKKTDEAENKDAGELVTDKPKETRKRKPKVEDSPAEADAKANDQVDAASSESNGDQVNLVEEITAVDLISEILNSDEDDHTESDAKEVILEVPTVEVEVKEESDTIKSVVEDAEEKPSEAVAEVTEAEDETATEDVMAEEKEPETEQLPPLMNVEHFFDYHSAADRESEEEAEQEAMQDTEASVEDNAESVEADTVIRENVEDTTVIQEYENYTILDEIEEEPHQKEVRAKVRKSRDDARYDEKKPRRVDKKFDMIELFIFTLVAIMLLTTFVFKHSVVEGGSMQNTLQPGDHLIISNLFYKPKQYDLIVFQDVNLKSGSITYKDPIVKRVIAVGGDHVEVIDMKTVKVNGVLVPEEFCLVDGEEPEYKELMYPREWDVPEGEVFVMGDHRNASDDSRYFGTIKEEAILGKVLFRIYPILDFGIVKPQDSKH